ncbi:hypothetical protein D3C85_1241880 [compost metagenome]
MQIAVDQLLHAGLQHFHAWVFGDFNGGAQKPQSIRQAGRVKPRDQRGRTRLQNTIVFVIIERGIGVQQHDFFRLKHVCGVQCIGNIVQSDGIAQ